MNLRIAISGPSGVGKSTLAKHIEEKYGIPFITTSTKPLWEKHEIKSHIDLIQKTLLNPEWGNDFQQEVLDYRIEKLKDHKAFVTDRSPIDNLAYYLAQVSQCVGEESVELYVNKCAEAMKMFNGILIIPFQWDNPLENDGMRINNRYYQFWMNGSFSVSSNFISQKVSHKFLAKSIQMWDWEKRTKFVNDWVEEELKPFIKVYVKED